MTTLTMKEEKRLVFIQRMFRGELTTHALGLNCTLLKNPDPLGALSVRFRFPRSTNDEISEHENECANGSANQCTIGVLRAGR